MKIVLNVMIGMMVLIIIILVNVLGFYWVIGNLFLIG